ncbi:MAG: hypothetical protein AAF456_05225 [Planctomycetota bacterium]
MLRRVSVFVFVLCLGITASSLVQAQEQKIFEGELTADDNRRAADDAYVDAFEVELEAGALVTVTMVAGDNDDYFDTVVELSGPSGQEYRNDDAADIQGSKLSTVIPETGVWDLTATSFSSGETGTYTITVDISQLERVENKRGELEVSDDRCLKNGEFYDPYDVEVEEGQTYMVTCVSSDYDTYVSVLYPGGHVYNDDIDGNTNKSMVTFTPDETGPAKIIVTSAYADSLGRYRLSMFKVLDPDQ